MTSASRILDAALALPPEERAELAALLEDSLERGPSEGIENAWRDEIRRRLEAYRSGETKTVSADDVEREAEAILEEPDSDIAATG